MLAPVHAEADDYPHCPGPSYRRIKARRVFARYISQQADMQVNIPSSLTLQVAHDLGVSDLLATPVTPYMLQQLSAKDPTVTELVVFADSQREVFKLMHVDSLQPFLQSEFFLSYLALTQPPP